MSTNQNVTDLVICHEVDRENQTPASEEGKKTFKDAARIQESLTSALERRVLLWIAKHMPSRIGPDHLTLVGFVAMLLAGGSYLLARWHPIGLLFASLCLGANWFGDSLDGTIARVRGHQRPRYGFYVDHMIDSFGGLFLVGGLSLSGYMDWRIAFGMLVGFYLLSIESYLAAYTLGRFRLSFGKFGPTEIRILLALGSLALWFDPGATVPGVSWRLFNFGGAVATGSMMVMVVVSTAWHTLRLYKQETVS